MKPKLYLVTKEFPFGEGEKSFIKPEYPYLCEKFDVNTIVAELPEEIRDQKKENLGADNTFVVSCKRNIWGKIGSYLRFLGEKACYKEILYIIKERRSVLKRIFRALMFGAAAETFYYRTKKITAIERQTRAVFYFYWYDYKCFGLTMHKDKYPNIQIVSRTHGYDLYDERELYGRQFFKEQMDKRIERLIFAAEYAKSYYLGRYRKQDSGKYPLHRLGVDDKNITVETRKREFKKTFLLLSCSHAISIKRVDLIIEGLSCIDRDIRWIHIGEGDQLEALKDKAEELLGAKNNIQYEFTGFLPNEKVIEFYRENYIGCFITTTSTEGGAPVSVQEALSFGIPVIAAAIGDLPQMIEENGVLLTENPTPDEIGHAIEDMVRIYGTEEYFLMCEKSLEIYQSKFNASDNFALLAEELEKLWENG